MCSLESYFLCFFRELVFSWAIVRSVPTDHEILKCIFEMY